MADGEDRPSGVEIRRAVSEEVTDVLSVLDAANLETDADVCRESIGRGTVFVATPRDSKDNGTLVGALVLDGEEITQVAVRRNRRGQGIGTALVRAAAAATGPSLVAEFDAGVRPFYEGLGFTIEPTDEPNRFVGRGPSCERE